MLRDKITSAKAKSVKDVLEEVTFSKESLKSIAFRVMSVMALAKMVDLAEEGIDYLKKSTSYSVELYSTESLTQYLAISKWMLERNFFKGNKRWTTESFTRYYDAIEETGLAVPVGIYWVRYKGCLLKIEKVGIKEKEAGKGDPAYLIKVFGLRSKEVFKEILGVLQETMTTNKLKIRNVGDYKTRLTEPRSLSTVVLDPKVKELIFSHLDTWSTSKALYQKRGVPYKTGILLEGPPGTGKTTLAKAIASYLKFELAILNINPKEMKTVVESLASVKPNTVVLIEEIDRSVSIPDPREAPSGGTLSLPGGRKVSEDKEPEPPMINGIEYLLNALDGVQSPEGVVFLMTTNHPEKLPEVLIRPGRIDIRAHIGLFTRDLAYEMADLFEVPRSFVDGLDEEQWKVPSRLQSLLFRQVGS